MLLRQRNLRAEPQVEQLIVPLPVPKPKEGEQ